MLFVTWPGMLLALIPVVAIEAWIMKPRLKLAVGEALRFTGIANVASTIVGIPLVWLGLVGLELVSTGGGTAFGLDTPWRKLLAVTVQAPWLIPYESELYWMVPAATLALLPAYFLASWGIEFAVVRKLLEKPASNIFEGKPQGAPVGQVRRAVLLANIGSYATLALVTLLWLGIAIARGPQRWAYGTGTPDLSVPNHRESTATASSAAKERIRIEFENPTRKHVTVRVRMGTGPCGTNPLITTQEIKGDAGFVFTAFSEPNELVCYSASMPENAGASSLGEWHTIRRTVKTDQENETYRVSIP